MTEEIVFFYYSKSSDKPPGKGVNEWISVEQENEFEDLARIPHWRQILSNFWIGEFEYGGLHYRTVEHAFQSFKIALVDAEKARLFCLESNSVLSKGTGDAARKQRKMIILTREQLREWDLQKEKVLEDLLEAKFTQVPLAREVLLATKTAQLWHGTRGIPNARQFTLEKIRSKLLNESLLVESPAIMMEESPLKKKGKVI